MDSKMLQYVLLAKKCKGRSLADVIMRATSEPSICAFGELLDLPSTQEIKTGEFSAYFDLLSIFTYGSWLEYKERCNALPALTQEQVSKLKQLTVVGLASSSKMLSYQMLMQQLDVPSVRELEDFIITQCFYPNIIKGKLNQRRAQLQVTTVVGRDVKRENVAKIASALSDWLKLNDRVLDEIECMVQSAVSESDAMKLHKEEIETKLEEARRNIKFELDMRAPEMLIMDDSFDYMEDERPRERPKSRRR